MFSRINELGLASVSEQGSSVALVSLSGAPAPPSLAVTEEQLPEEGADGALINLHSLTATCLHS